MYLIRAETAVKQKCSSSFILIALRGVNYTPELLTIIGLTDEAIKNLILS
ncbi:hypothetical protein PN480_15085 [Dolichospermum circinale CS-1225]|nr:hypothetical protein [Dolichospermum circinale]MDB9465968.1 hypothetical protein [Dolichospermum circinale CS-539/09]MDB9471068.1 hypothetical protein [Dolichospermum circinale CS-539]MDB9523259.1 hypothetical protein [Dolichospermum circinale CS-1225]